MEQTNSIYKEFGILGSFFKFMGQHTILANIILILEALAAIYAVFTYNFTTNI